MALDIPKHVKYWRRCFTTPLPRDYTSNDSTRLLFAFFTVSALDLLSIPLNPEERSSVRRWVFSLQHPDGGFCGSPTHAFSGTDARNGCANLAATFFALLLLGGAATGDEARAAFAGVRRGKLLRWMKKLQRKDGSFGQVLWEGEADGGRDVRHSYLVSCIRWMLLRDGEHGGEDDVDVDRMVEHIRRTQTYDGGVAELSEHESHAGYAYCAIGALRMLDRVSASSKAASQAIASGVVDHRAAIHFLVHRQFNYLADEEGLEDGEESQNYVETKLGASSEIAHVGWNGRWNKKADTCYCWWVAGTLSMMNSFESVNVMPSCRFLTDVTQHGIVGGFAKYANGPPDVYHSYLGLAALAITGHADLKKVDVGLCCSEETARKVELARDGMSGQQSCDLFAGDGFWETVGAQ